MQTINPETLLNNTLNLPLIDVRSPKEFAEGHIPGAVNMPLFDNEERAVVGTLYKQKGRQAAVLKGLEIVGPKMAVFAREAIGLALDNKLRVHCWRGGMRSASMAWLFERLGLEVEVLSGGYKAYRQYCAAAMGDLPNVIVLKGSTGSGKTAILHELAKRGEQVLDLEGLANHRGSAFGGIGKGEQPTTQQFQNNLYKALALLDTNQRIWVEGESKSIGRVYIPDPFWKVMCKARIVEIVVPFSHRVERLVKEYAGLDAAEMQKAIRKLEKRLSNGKMNEILDMFAAQDYENTASLLLAYYDRTYRHSDSSYVHKITKINVDTGDAASNAQILIDSFS